MTAVVAASAATVATTLSAMMPASPAVARERQPGDDRGQGHRERGDDKGGNTSVTRGEREPGDDHGRHHEPGDR